MTDRRWSREDLAWAAGLFEGEGSLSRSNKVPIACLGMTDLDVLDRFAAVLGVGRVYPFTRRNPVQAGRPWKDGAQWMTTTFEEMQAVVAMLWPWLGQRRRARATELLLGYRARLAARQRGAWGNRQTLAGELFGKRLRDLTRDEQRTLWRVKSARSRAKRNANGHGPTDRNRRRG